MMKNTQMHKLIDDYFPNDKERAEAFMRVIFHGITSELQKFSTNEYKKFKSSTNTEFRDNPYILGMSDGADICIEIVQNMLDE